MTPHTAEIDAGNPTPALATLLGVSLVAGASLLLEVSLTRYFSFHLWYHYAFMIISIALLGLSAASVTLSLLRHRLARHQAPMVMAYCALVCGVLTLAALPLLQALHALWDDQGQSAIGALCVVAGYWGVLFVPFFAAGAAISWALLSYARRATTVYAFDLGGAAVGCMGAVLLLSRLHAEQAISAASALCFAAGAVLAQASPRRPVLSGVALLAMVATILMTSSNTWVSDAVTPSKGLARDVQTGGKIIASRPTMTGRVDVVEGLPRKFAWGLSAGAFRLPIPDQLTVRIDGDALTTITRYDGASAKWVFMEHAPSTLPYVVKPPAKVLIIGPGGGMDVVNALNHGARRVVGVEVNRGVIDLVKGQFAAFAGNIYSRDPRVEIIHSDGRNYAERAAEDFDLVQLTLVDTFAAISSGALSLSEDFLYTTEAFRAYLDALTDDGVLALGRTRHEVVSLAMLLQAATLDREINLADHFLAIDNPAQQHSLVVLFKKSALSTDEISRAIRFAARAKLRLLCAPGHCASLPALAALLNNKDRARLVSTAPAQFAPETDDFPFYFREQKWSALLGTYRGGAGNLLIILTVALLFGAVFIIAPLWVTSKAVAWRNRALLGCFVVYGLGFMFIELALLVKFSLFLGHPVRSMSITLFSLLLFAGVGSGLGSRIKEGLNNRLVLGVFAAIGVAAVLYGLALPPVTQALMGLPLAARLAIAVGLLAPLALLLGLPLPLSLQALGAKEERLVLWAWGLNGVASVIGSVLCTIQTHALGYRSAFLSGAVCYLVGLALVLRAGQRD